MKQKLIVIEGLDGAGKSTQIGLLTEHFKEKGIETRFVHFPRMGEGVYGEMIAKFLRGEYGSVSEVHPQLVALLYAQDRLEFAPTVRKWLKEGYLVLMDRYVLSNIAFQCAKTPDPVKKAALRDWIFEFEFKHNRLPKPDLSLYLDVPFEFTLQSLQGKRKGDDRNYLGGKDDIHEKSLDLQAAVKQEYDYLTDVAKKAKKVKCYTENNGALSMRSMHDINQEIIDCILQTK